MTLASILHYSGGNSLVLLLANLPPDFHSRNPKHAPFLFFSPINPIIVRDRFRERKRRAPA